ncbi:MAG: prepilin-type N-terminal cleavage/methylation domain-containing protein, partial [Planctomycetota bacterium]
MEVHGSSKVRSPKSSAGFTLVEAAVTLAIVAIVLVTILKGMEGSKLTAFHTKQKKVAYELGMGLIGEFSVGLWREEIEPGLTGSFAEQDEPDFFWELALGEEVFEETNDDTERPFDNFAARRDWEERNRSETEEEEMEDGEIEEPFEKIRVRVTFPQLKDFTNELILEAWVPWEEVYGPSEEEASEADAADAAGA